MNIKKMLLIREVIRRKIRCERCVLKDIFKDKNKSKRIRREKIIEF